VGAKYFTMAKELGFLMSKLNSRSIIFLALADRFGGFFHHITMGGLLIAIISLTACSSVPNTINPAEWYKNTVNLIAGEDVQKTESGSQTDKNKIYERGTQTNKAKTILSRKSAMPKLSSVPKRPKKPLAQGLVSDQRKRKYAEPIARQGEVSQMMAQQTPRPSINQQQTPVKIETQKAPPAMPASPVTSEPMVQPKKVDPTSTYSSIKPKKFSLTPQEPSAPPMRPNPLNSIVDDPFTTVVVSADGVNLKSTSAVSTSPAQVQNLDDSSPNLASGSQQSPQISGTKVATILFKTGSSVLNEGDRKIIGQVVKLHKQQGGTITIVGHASSRTRNLDPVTHKMVNYGVSVDRANRIASELKKMGLAPESIFVDARSDSMPLYYEIMPSGEAGNRRAEIYFNN